MPHARREHRSGSEAAGECLEGVRAPLEQSDALVLASFCVRGESQPQALLRYREHAVTRHVRPGQRDQLAESKMTGEHHLDRWSVEGGHVSQHGIGILDAPRRPLLRDVLPGSFTLHGDAESMPQSTACSSAPLRA